MWWNARKASQGSRAIGSAASRTSRNSYAASSVGGSVGMRSSQPNKEIELQFFIRQTESLYPPWWTRLGVISWFRDLPDDTLWNCYICGCVLVGVVWSVAQLQSILIDILDVIYNISYAIHVFAIGYKLVSELENTDITFWIVLGFLVDLGSFAHYVKDYDPMFNLICYYVRLHRPFKYLWSLNDYNLKGSILGTTLKYCYIFMVLRITWAYCWIHVDVVGNLYTKFTTGTDTRKLDTDEDPAQQFLSAIYIVNKMFIPIGPSQYPDTDMERICCLFIMLSGCLVVTGAAVASLSLIISLYMRPEETFRARYRLIMKEMKETKVPPTLREKVKTFYMMYWHKQRAVSETRLLPTFPPTLPATINIDIYFEATQKARILRELSYQMLSELARKMQTIHYIPGDPIIKRGSKKSKIIYITYGDIEMLTAEDDSTAILRMTRGTVLTPCGGAAAAAVGLSHVAVRAATFCTAHVLTAPDLWRIISKHAVSQDHAGPILASFTDHIEKVKRHYTMKTPVQAIHKSSILCFNRNLMALKKMKSADGQCVLASSDVFLEIAGCYIMRNREDATLTDQSDEICLRATFPCILQPSSSLIVAWQFFVALLILVVCATHPYYLMYKKIVPIGFRFFDYVMTGVFVLDLIVHLSTGANVEEGVPITFRQTSSQQMRSHWFVFDVVGTLPIFEFIGTGHFAGINKLLRLPRLFRVLKSMEETCVYRSNVLRFLSYTLLLLIACYLIAAMQQGFMCFQSGYCLVTNFTHRPFWEQKPLDEESVSSRLVFGLYWAISMINFTIHRETWGKDNWQNVIYTLIILEVCIVLRTFMEAIYSATIMVTTALREDYGAKIAMVTNFLIRNEVDPQLRKRFINYLQLCWHTDKAYKMTHKSHSTIFYDLPPHVFQDIVGRNLSKYILTIPFMRLISKEDLREVSSLSKLFYTSPNEILLNTGELTNEIYVIKLGICEVLDPITKKTVAQLSTKKHFGALVCLLRLPVYYTVRTVTHVQLIRVPFRALAKSMEHPQIKSTLDYLRTRPEFHRLQQRLPSFCKYEELPPTANMMHFKLPRKHEPDSEFLHPFKRLGFLSILRYVFPRYTIRPDGKYLMRYEWFRVTCALCSAQLFPHYTYLVLQWPYLYYVALFLDLTAWYDIVQRMLIGYFNKDGILVYHPASTAAYYIKGPFLADFFGCLSLENLEATRVDYLNNKYHVTPTEQFLMMNRLIQLYRMPSAMMMLKDYIERRDILMVIQAIPLFMAMLNLLTCFMIFYSVKIFYTIEDDGTYDWVIEPLNDKGGSWLHLFKDAFRFNLTSTPWNLHLATYFWVVYECTTTGYGIFNPSNHDLMRVLFIGMASSTMIITYYSVRIISIRANVNNSLAGFQQHLKDINVFMAREKLVPDLQKEIRHYYEYNWEKMGGIDYRGVLKLCDQINLRTDAILHIYGPTFAKCPLFNEADVSLLRILGRSVRSVYFLRDMKIIEHDDMITHIYIVDYGGVEVRVTTGEMCSVLRLPKGSVFGNLDGTACTRSPYNVVATSRLHLLMIKSTTFADITRDFPALKELMAKSRTGDKKMYILGGEAQIKFRRNVQTGPTQRAKKSLLKYIYFQEGVLQTYLIVVCLVCIYLDMYNAGYQDNSTWLLITLYVLDFCFFLKIFTQHSLPLLTTSKSTKTLLLPIRRLYFKREFRYDLISVLPIELFSFASYNNGWMWFAWLRLNRTFRIATVYKCLRRRSESITVNLTLTTIMAVFIWFTLFVHATACIWYFVGIVEDTAHANSSWMYTDDGGTHCDNHYICSLYFVITTFTQNGVGDIIPQKQSEVLFVAILQILSTMVFMVYVGEFSNIIQYQSYRSFSFYSKYLELQEFMKNNRVSRNLVTIVNKYTLHLWRETRGFQVPKFLQYAPPSLRLRIMSAIYLHHITRHHIFEECEPAFLRQLVGCLRLYTYNEGMYVVKESDITDSMYVIHTGKVKETCEDMDISARVYPAGSYFGILQGLLRNTPYTHSYQTMIKSQVLTLNLDDWEYLLKHFPESKMAIHKHMMQVGDKDMDQSNWPGGAPTEPEIPVYEPLADLPTDMPGIFDQFPETTRRFGRPSETEASIVPPSSLRRKSQFFSWPTDSRGDDETRAGSVSPAAPSGKKEEKANQGEEIPVLEEKPKMKFFEKITSTAKKIMGRVSETEALAAVTGRDELFLEEDEEATGALLAQFEAAKKLADKDIKKNKSRRKSKYPAEEEEENEKHMLTLDMKSSSADKVDETEDESFQMRPLRIQDSADEKSSSSSSDTPKTLNLTRKKREPDPETSEIQITSTIDMTKVDSTQKKPDVETSVASRSSSFSRTPMLFFPGSTSAQAGRASSSKLLYPELGTSEVQVNSTIDMTKADSAQETTSDTKTSDTTKTDGTVPARSSSFSRRPILFYPGPEADQETTDTQANRASPPKLVYPEPGTSKVQVTSTIDMTKADSAQEKTSDTEVSDKTKADDEADELARSSSFSNREKTTDFQAGRKASPELGPDASKEVIETQASRTSPPKLLYPSSDAAEETTDNQVARTSPPKFSYPSSTDAEDTTDTQAGQTLPSKLSYPGHEAAEETTDSQAGRTSPPKLSYPAPKASLDSQPAQESTSAETNQDTKDTQPVTMGVKTALDTKDMEPARDTTVIQTTQDFKDSQSIPDSKITQATPYIKNEQAKDNMSTQADEIIKDEQPVQSTIGTQAAQDTKDNQPTQESTSTQVIQNNNGTHSTRDAMGTLATEITKPKQERKTSASDAKLFQFYSDTNESVDLGTPSKAISVTSTVQGTAKKRGSLTREDKSLDQNKPVPVGSGNVKQSNRSASEIKLLQFLSDTDINQTGEKPAAPTTSTKDKGEKKSESTHTVNLTDETTHTSASKLNRRFVRVRYEEHGGEEIEEEEDETAVMDRSAGESNEGDDEATTSTSGSSVPSRRQIQKKFD